MGCRGVAGQMTAQGRRRASAASDKIGTERRLARSPAEGSAYLWLRGGEVAQQPTSGHRPGVGSRGAPPQGCTLSSKEGR
jgi:hypothetical protein